MDNNSQSKQAEVLGLHQCSVCDPSKNNSHIQVLVTNGFPIPSEQNWNFGLQVSGRLLIANHLDQSQTIYPIRNTGNSEKILHILTVFIRLL